jgi:cytosine/adenosine deaminase-related metal-dependent hydrolase
VLVHGVAVTRAGFDLLRRRTASLVWCPTSNLGMLGRTLSRDALRSGIPIALATDSALSAPVDLLDELRVARRYLPAARIYEMVSRVPAAMLRLSRASTKGDWIAMCTSASTAADALQQGQIAVVAVAGRIRLIAEDLAEQLPREMRRRLQLLRVEGRPPVLVDANVRALRRAAEKHLGSEFRLAGKRVLA